MIRVRLCPRCWLHLESLLRRAALSRAFFQTISNHLRRCSECRGQMNLISVIQLSPEIWQ